MARHIVGECAPCCGGVDPSPDCPTCRDAVQQVRITQTGDVDKENHFQTTESGVLYDNWYYCYGTAWNSSFLFDYFEPTARFELDFGVQGDSGNKGLLVGEFITRRNSDNLLVGHSQCYCWRCVAQLFCVDFGTRITWNTFNSFQTWSLALNDFISTSNCNASGIASLWPGPGGAPEAPLWETVCNSTPHKIIHTSGPRNTSSESVSRCQEDSPGQDYEIDIECQLIF